MYLSKRSILTAVIYNIRVAVFSLLFLCFVPFWASIAHAKAQQILVLHSYPPGHLLTDNTVEGMRSILSEKSDQIQCQVEYLDTQAYHPAEYNSLTKNSLAEYKLKGRSFDLVLLSGNDALDFALEYRNNLFPDIPIIFSGIDEKPASLPSWPYGITGITNNPAYRETLELALRLHPQTEEIIVIGGTKDLADRVSRDKILALSDDFDSTRFTYWDDLSIDDVTKRLQQLDAGRLLFLNGTVTDGSGQPLLFDTSIKRIRNACRAPVYGIWDFYLGKGIVGGKLMSASRQGRLAAEMALRVLSGEALQKIPVVVDDGDGYMFDDNELQRLGLSSESLPEDSLIIDQPSAFYTLTKTQMWILLGIMTFSMIDLLFVLLKYRKTERGLKESMAQTKLLLNSAAEGIYGLDLKGNCTFCNPACLRLLGFEKESELLNINLHQLIHHTRADGTPYPAEDCVICHAYQRNSEIHLEDEVFWRKDGSRIPVEYWSYPLRRGNQTIGAVVSFLDITDRKLVEQKLMAANQELDAFVYTVSHDLRTPISAVVGYTDLIKETYANELSEEVLELLNIIEQQGEKMSLLTEDLLALARAGNIKSPATPVDTNDALKYVLTELDHKIVSVGANVVVGDLPDILVPESLLIQIFENLIGNALRYACVDGCLIEVGGERAGDIVRFYIRDFGQGIPKEEQSKIFDVFYRGSTGKKMTGSGVGLATVQKITRLYGGQVTVEDTPGGGATFWVELNDAS